MPKTIPIRREQEDEYPRLRGVKWIPRRTQLNHSFYDNRRHEGYSFYGLPNEMLGFYIYNHVTLYFFTYSF